MGMQGVCDTLNLCRMVSAYRMIAVVSYIDLLPVWKDRAAAKSSRSELGFDFSGCPSLSKLLGRCCQGSRYERVSVRGWRKIVETVLFEISISTKLYPSVFHAYTSKVGLAIVLFEARNLDEVSNRIPPTSQSMKARSFLCTLPVIQQHLEARFPHVILVWKGGSSPRLAIQKHLRRVRYECTCATCMSWVLMHTTCMYNASKVVWKANVTYARVLVTQAAQGIQVMQVV